jgi:hypothetical protein
MKEESSKIRVVNVKPSLPQQLAFAFLKANTYIGLQQIMRHDVKDNMRSTESCVTLITNFQLFFKPYFRRYSLSHILLCVTFILSKS